MTEIENTQTELQKCTFEEVINKLRKEIQETAFKIEYYQSDLETEQDDLKDDDSDSYNGRKEMIANTELAYRHLEDARMRLGKALQAKNGGTSIYDKKEEVDTEEPAK